MSVIGAISPQLERAEIERAQRKPTESLQAYDYYLRGLANLYRFTREANLEALKLTQIANTIDPEFALPYALGARRQQDQRRRERPPPAGVPLLGPPGADRLAHRLGLPVRKATSRSCLWMEASADELPSGSFEFMIAPAA